MQNLWRTRPLTNTVRSFGRGASITVPPSIPLVLRRRAIRRGLLGVVAVLVLLSLAGQFARHGLGVSTAMGMIEFFHLDAENNLPTWYQSVALLAAAAMLAAIALPLRRVGARHGGHWAALAVIFAFLSMDEVGSLHERSSEPLQRLVGASTGLWTSAWIVLGFVAVAALAIAYWRFLFDLPRRERIQVVSAAALLVGGALGFEIANAALDLGELEQRKETLVYILMVHAEETLEMLGVVVFLDFLLGRLDTSPPLAIRVAP